MPPPPFFYSLSEILTDPGAAVNNLAIDALISHLSETPTQPLNTLVQAVYPVGESEKWGQWNELLDALPTELKIKAEALMEGERAEAARRERAAFLIGYFFRHDPIALLGCWKQQS